MLQDILSTLKTVLVVVLVTGAATPVIARQARPSPPVALRVAHVTDQSVTLAWGASPGGGDIDAYVVEGGAWSGAATGSARVDASETTATFVLPEGTYYLRVRAIASGVLSPSSNEVMVVIGDRDAPDAPLNVSAVARQSDVVLTWTLNRGASIDDLLVDVTGTVHGTIAIPKTSPATFSGVPAGTYTITLRARGPGGISAPSAAVTVSLPGGGAAAGQGARTQLTGYALPVRYEDFTSPRLAALIQREQLHEVWNSGTSEFDRILRLKDWVAAQWEFGNPDPYPPWDAMTILDAIRGGYTGGFCAQYSQVLVQVLAAFGIPARYVEVGHERNPFNHYPAEVWSNDFNKWVLMDASYNLHFERRGLPLSALEVHEAYVSGAAAALSVVRGTATAGHPDPFELPHRTAELYYYLRYHLKADHVARPGEDPFDRFGDMVEWHDDLTVPWEISTLESQFAHAAPTRLSTRDRAVVEAPLNQVWIAPRQTRPSQVTLDLTHNVLQFSHFEYRFVDAAGVPGPWRAHDGAQVRWDLASGGTRIEVRGINERGVAGPVASWSR